MVEGGPDVSKEESRVRLERARSEDIEDVTALVAAYHAFERIDIPNAQRRLAVSQLLADQSLGDIWLIYCEDLLVGYIAICFGYSIEFAGRDAFLDEFFLKEEARGRGIGGHVVDSLSTQLSATGIKALHLEVDNDNHGAQRFYARHRFVARNKYHLMSIDLTEPERDPS